MREPLDIFKPQVRELRRYSLDVTNTRIKLNQNENPWGTPQRIKNETLSRLQQLPWSRYPDFIPDDLHRQLAAFSGWQPQGVLVGNGSNELIQALLMVTVSKGRKVLISEPTFTLYRQITTVLDGEILSVPLRARLDYDTEAIFAALESESPDLVIVCSPNNPTGCVLAEHDLRSLLEIAPGLVVLDEAYFEFSGQSAVRLLHEFENLVVLRTFSKAMALAGLRIGYLLGAPRVVAEIQKALLPYNLNVISQTAASVALEQYQDNLHPLVMEIISERERLIGEISVIPGLRPVPSRANFMLVHSRIDPRSVFAELRRRDILIRDVSGYPMLRDYFRFNVGTAAENDLLIKALREIFKPNSA